ncbi:hypothetical protein FISHEDRAFT_37801 [Fistulina hepatica ATCC 64428]|nr:hypothetical protein FISHEDRAFT_37801 [Fistulina hepatica ATCC 64428]
MLQELSHMDRITQLQDEIQQILTIMANTIAYLTSRTNFLQVSEEIPITKQRNKEKYDEPDVFAANQKELIADLIVKAKQIEYLIDSLPEPEAEELQASARSHLFRLQALETEMDQANAEYMEALKRTKSLHAEVSKILHSMLADTDALPSTS